MKLDRTAFKMGNAESASDDRQYWQQKSLKDRLEATFYLNSVAYNFDINNPPKMDKTIFYMRRHG